MYLFGSHSNKSNKYENKFFKKIMTKGIKDSSGKQVTDREISEVRFSCS